MSDKTFEYAKELTVAALQGGGGMINGQSANNIMQPAKTMEFFEKVYIKLQELESKLTKN